MKNYFIKGVLLVAALLCYPTSKAQVLYSAHTGIYSAYLGEITYPGIGVGVGYKAEIIDRVNMIYTMSFLHSAGRYENIPLDPGALNETSDFVSLKNLKGLSVNMTNFSIDICLQPYRGERFSCDIYGGLGLNIVNLKYAEVKPYSLEDSKRLSRRSPGLGMSLGVGFDYVINEKFTVRLSPNVMMSSVQFQTVYIGKYGLMSCIILNLDN